jgi:hypothetical protein
MQRQHALAGDDVGHERHLRGLRIAVGLRAKRRRRVAGGIHLAGAAGELSTSRSASQLQYGMPFSGDHAPVPGFTVTESWMVLFCG